PAARAARDAAAAAGGPGRATAGHPPAARGAGAGALCPMDARREAGVAHGYDAARCAPVAARHPDAYAGHDRHRALLREPAAATLLARMLGRRDVRCGAALSQGGSVAAPDRAARAGAESVVADAAAIGECGRLCQLS